MFAQMPFENLGIRPLIVPRSVSDLHVWRVGNGRYACNLALVATAPVTADDVRRQLAIHEELVHVTVEVVSAVDSGTALLVDH